MVAGRVPLGAKLGRYEIVKRLARGGMADLSIARIDGFARHVVIKHLRPEESEDETFVKMFLGEARLAALLHHHNIVQVLDIGEQNGTPYFAMEYVHGEDLRTLLARLSSRNERIPLAHAVTIGATVAAALHHAHDRAGADGKPLGIVHRDVTPANIIVAYDGNVKVADFGIAKATIQTVKTNRGKLKGKVPYMSPEQCVGAAVDRRSDVFAVGIVLYELVTTRRLFKGTNEFQTMSAIVGGDVPPPSKHREGLPKPLQQIILKALARTPEDRYQTADELREALETYALRAGLRTSPSALANYMKQVFGERLEPWMKDAGDVERDLTIDFDKTETGLVAIPELERLPKSALIEDARKRAGSQYDTVPTPLRLVEAETSVAVKPAPEKPAEATPAAITRGDSTAVVKPLPPPGTVLSEIVSLTVDDLMPAEGDEPRLGRKWIVAAGVASVALVVAIIIVISGQRVKPADPKRDPNPEVHVEQRAQEPPPVAKQAPVAKEPEPVVVKEPEPVVAKEEPVAKEPEPVVAKEEPVAKEPEPVVTEPEPATELEPVVVKAAVKEPVVVKRPAVKQVAAKPPVKKPVIAKPPPKQAKPPPKWDPDALFLKRKQ